MIIYINRMSDGEARRPRCQIAELQGLTARLKLVYRNTPSSLLWQDIVLIGLLYICVGNILVYKTNVEK